ncbi:Fur family transcriptional regulator [Calderihabitans maritimus]|uniref:Ferric uptake regulator family protein n=1 Tax=Calderihabitans maritimus TaxID=1246530 RepID=A0A1Z5HY23_9FIRM|nr:Fur family transcriptional regulator [Calderihabitans maritimus]GAW94241.1 ferric uptake regulator family protein [Calderihabitans maritimus]
MKHQLEEIYAKFQQNDYKITPQRQVIVKAFLENAKEHLSAEEVYTIVKKEHPEIGLATVYRTLDLLAELDILQKMNFGDGKSRYEFNEQHVHHHHHLICLKCGRVIEFEDDLLETLETVIEKKNGFEIVDHQVKFLGYCQDCKEN